MYGENVRKKESEYLKEWAEWTERSTQKQRKGSETLRSKAIRRAENEDKLKWKLEEKEKGTERERWQREWWW